MVAPSIFSKCHVKHDFVVTLCPLPKREEEVAAAAGAVAYC